MHASKLVLKKENKSWYFNFIYKLQNDPCSVQKKKSEEEEEYIFVYKISESAKSLLLFEKQVSIRVLTYGKEVGSWTMAIFVHPLPCFYIYNLAKKNIHTI